MKSVFDNLLLSCADKIEKPCILICGAAFSGKSSLWNLLAQNTSYEKDTKETEIEFENVTFLCVDLDNIVSKYGFLVSRLSSVQALIFVSRIDENRIPELHLNFSVFSQLFFKNLPAANKFCVLTHASDRLVFDDQTKTDWLMNLPQNDLLREIQKKVSKMIFISNPNPRDEYPLGRNDDLRTAAREDLEVIFRCSAFQWQPACIMAEELENLI